MAQLNDLVVLGNTSLVGETNVNAATNIDNTLTVENTTYLKNNIEITRSSNAANPYLFLKSSSGSAYVQLNGTTVALGNGWANSLQVDSSGNATLPKNMTAAKFIGPLEGNADSSSSLKSGDKLTSTTVDTMLSSTASLKINTCDNTVYNNNDGLLLTASWSSAYGAQIWIDDGSGEGGMALRNRNSSGWNPWRQVLTSNNSSDNTFSGTNTFSGKVILSKTTDAIGSTNNEPALRIGNISGDHLELDGNEIMAKSSGTAVGPIYINNDGGSVTLGGATTIKSTLTVNSISNMTSTPTKYYVDNGSGKLSYRTREQMQSDVGGGAGTFKMYLDSLKE